MHLKVGLRGYLEPQKMFENMETQGVIDIEVVHLILAVCRRERRRIQQKAEWMGGALQGERRGAPRNGAAGRTE